LRKDNFTIVMAEAGGRDRDADQGVLRDRGFWGGGTCRLSGHNGTPIRKYEFCQRIALFWQRRALFWLFKGLC